MTTDPSDDAAFYIPFDAEECAPLQMQFSGPWDSPIEVTVRYAKFGNLVGICLPEILGQATTPVTEIRSLSVLDERYRPINNPCKLVLLTDNDVPVLGLLRVTQDGYIILRRAPDQTVSFTGSGLTGLPEGFSIMFGVVSS